MLIDTDVILAHLKEKDKLKEVAEKVFSKISKGELEVIANRESLHEIYYILRDEEKLPISDILSKIGALVSIPNLTWIPTTIDVDLLALALMQQYGITYTFEAYQIATCLLHDKDKTIISTNHDYDRVSLIKRIDPASLI